MDITLTFSAKEIQVIEMMAPPKTATEVCNLVLRDWFQSNVERMSKAIKTQDQVLDELISFNDAKVATEAAMAETPPVV